MNNEATIGGIVVGGQPAADDIRNGRFATVVNVRLADEPGNITGALVEGTGIRYASVPLTADTLSREHITEIRTILDESEGTALIH